MSLLGGTLPPGVGVGTNTVVDGTAEVSGCWVVTRGVMEETRGTAEVVGGSGDGVGTTATKTRVSRRNSKMSLLAPAM